MNAFLQCPSCNDPLSREVVRAGMPISCPRCRAVFHVELFPAADLAPPPPQAGDPLLHPEEAACYHHPDRKAAQVCAECGRFLCSLCALEIHEEHYCATCLEHKRRHSPDPRWITSRVIYDELALLMAVGSWLGLVFLGPLALVLAWRHRRSPMSLTERHSWRMPAAAILAVLNILAVSVLLIWLVVHWSSET